MTQPFIRGGLTVALLLLLVVGAGPVAATGRPPPPGTIVAVTGDRDRGFTVAHLDGRVEHTPTLSEARAECGEYDARLDRVRCRTEVRVWYRDLGRLRQALDFAHGPP
jgi:hypothetical protein